MAKQRNQNELHSGHCLYRREVTIGELRVWCPTGIRCYKQIFNIMIAVGKSRNVGLFWFKRSNAYFDGNILKYLSLPTKSITQVVKSLKKLQLVPLPFIKSSVNHHTLMSAKLELTYKVTEFTGDAPVYRALLLF